MIFHEGLALNVMNKASVSDPAGSQKKFLSERFTAGFTASLQPQDTLR
jgi:hypothetical protein